MYNTNYKCVKPFDVWLDAIGPDGKKFRLFNFFRVFERSISTKINKTLGCCRFTYNSMPAAS